jgi:hypothetical protein
MSAKLRQQIEERGVHAASALVPQNALKLSKACSPATLKRDKSHAPKRALAAPNPPRRG